MSQRKLLLADDSITIQKVVNLTFADEGIEVVTVGDGDSAMEKMSDFKPDLIMADVNMPGLNGYQICEKVKQSDEFGNTPVILLVGSFEPFDETEAQRVGADDFLTKPFQSIRQLVSKVTELLDADEKNSSLGDENEIPQETLRDFSVSQTGFGDDETDDEMMQTMPGGFALDETAKFETKEPSETPKNLPDAETSPEEVEQSSSLANQDEINESEISSNSSTGGYSSGLSQTETHYQNSFQENPEPMTSQKSQFANLDFDDDFLLELPPDEDEEIEEQTEEVSSVALEETQQTEISQNLSETDEPETEIKETPELAQPEEISDHYEENDSSVAEIPEQTEPEKNSSEANENLDGAQPNHASFVASSQLSSETIDIIVQKVIERLSDKAVREIAWEVVPQVTDEIVKKMAEEKLKES